MRPKPIKQRICEAYKALDTNHPKREGVCYYALLRATFPDDQYPRAMRPSSNGGPPGCAMAFGLALRKIGAWISCAQYKGRSIRITRETLNTYTGKE